MGRFAAGFASALFMLAFGAMVATESQYLRCRDMASGQLKMCIIGKVQGNIAPRDLFR